MSNIVKDYLDTALYDLKRNKEQKEGYLKREKEDIQSSKKRVEKLLAELEEIKIQEGEIKQAASFLGYDLVGEM